MQEPRTGARTCPVFLRGVLDFGKLKAAPEEGGMLTGHPPHAHVALAVGAACRCVQAKAVDRPALPLIMQRPEVTHAQHAKEPHDRPRHPVTTGIPVPDGTQRHAQVLGARLTAQQAVVAQFPEVLRGDVVSPLTLSF